MGDDALGVGKREQIVDGDELHRDLFVLIEGAGAASVDVIELFTGDALAESEEAHGLFAGAGRQVHAVGIACQGAQIGEIVFVELDAQFFVQLLGGNTSEVARAIEHAGADLHELEAACGETGLDGDHHMMFSLAFEDGEHCHGAAASEDDAGDEVALAVGDGALELDEADPGAKHIHRLKVDRVHGESRRVHRSKPVRKGLGGQGSLDVDAVLRGDGDAIDLVGCAIGHGLFLLGPAS